MLKDIRIKRFHHKFSRPLFRLRFVARIPAEGKNTKKETI